MILLIFLALHLIGNPLQQTDFLFLMSPLKIILRLCEEIPTFVSNSTEICRNFADLFFPLKFLQNFLNISAELFINRLIAYRFSTDFLGQLPTNFLQIYFSGNVCFALSPWPRSFETPCLYIILMFIYLFIYWIYINNLYKMIGYSSMHSQTFNNGSAN